jgi:hypothetical protein
MNAPPPSTRPRGAPVAPYIAASLLAERRRIAMAFRAGNAIAPGTARDLKALGLTHDAPFDELLRLGAIRQEANGFWFDEATYDRTIEHPRFRTLGVIAVVGIFLLLLVALVGVFTA